MSDPAPPSARGLTIPPAASRIAVGAIGAVYLVLGLVGFATGEGMGPDASRTVLIFGISTLLNVVHTAVGLLGLAAAHKAATAKAYGWALFFAFLGLTAYSVAATAAAQGADPANVTAANMVLYALTAAAGLVVCLARYPRTPGGEQPEPPA